MATCENGVCGTAPVAAGTPTPNQVTGDCRREECDGAGSTTIVNDDTDVNDDGKECTDDTCSGGTPSNEPKLSGTPCSSGLCDTGGACVQCLAPNDCPGTDDECKQRNCTNNVCGMTFANAGTVLSSQTAGDCKRAECDGSGNITNVDDGSDLPDDSNGCTDDVCTTGTPSNPPKNEGTPCGTSGVCNTTGQCVGCNAPTDCPGSDDECKQRSCDNNVCGVTFTNANTPVTTQVVGDCKQDVCDGNGSVISVNLDTDPNVDGNQCTQDLCSAGTASNPPENQSKTCTQNGGQFCDGAGTCVECNNASTCGGGTCTSNQCAPAVVSTMPTNGAVGVAITSSVTVTFSEAMNPATLTTQSSAGACSGSIQVSSDDFVTCIALTSPALSSGNTVATVTPSKALAYGLTYKIRVTTAVTDAGGVAMAADFTSSSGFTTPFPAVCSGSVVISQVYGGGGNASAVYTHDFIELHNRTGATVNLDGWSLQYASSTGTSWTVHALSGTIPAGGYFLFQMASGGSNGAALPTPDQIGSQAMAGTSAKVALVAGTAALTGACPTLGAPPIIDFLGYGTGANCFEGSSAMSSNLSNTKGATRDVAGCADANDNAADFLVVTPAPRNTASPSAFCSCPTQTNNETNTPQEADFCNLQSPGTLTLTGGTNSGLVYGRIYESGVTEAAGANASVQAQLGYGPTGSDPSTQSNWAFVDATFNTQYTNDDEYQASFAAPPVVSSTSYAYTFRMSLDGGQSWTYCDTDGAGSNAGLTFSAGALGAMTVNP